MDTKNGATFIRHNEYYDVDKKAVDAEIVILIKNGTTDFFAVE